jgi:hypothetical protein
MRRALNANQSAPDGQSTVTEWNDVIVAGSDWTYNDTTGQFTLVGREGKWFFNATVKLDTTDADPYVGRLFWQRNGSGSLVSGATGESDLGSDTFLTCTGFGDFSLTNTLQLEINFQGNANAAGTIIGDSDSEITFLWLGV